MATFQPSPDLDPKVAQAIEDAMDALRAELLGHLAPQAPPPPAPVGGTAGASPSRLEAAIEALDLADSQTDLLAGLLEQAGAFADRALFLVRDGGELKGWAAFGFPGGDSDVDRVAIEIPEAVANRSPVDKPLAGQRICEQMDAPIGTDSLIVPFILRGKSAGALYADRSAKGVELDRPALRILCYVAAQALETLPLRRASGAAAAPPVVDAEVEAEVEVEDVDAELDRMIDEVVPEPLVEEYSEADVDVDAMIEEVERDASAGDDDGDIVSIRHEVTPPGFETVEEDEDFAGSFDDEAEPVATVEVETPFQASKPSAIESARALEDAEVAPPDDLEGPGWAFSGAGSISDDGRHEEARRLARLLVTEIKLYNEEKVRQGRENHDLYEQLRDDIERSRRIYDERIDDEVRQQSDYFEEEVVRILAGGDSTALGT